MTASRSGLISGRKASLLSSQTIAEVRTRLGRQDDATRFRAFRGGYTTRRPRSQPSSTVSVSHPHFLSHIGRPARSLLAHVAQHRHRYALAHGVVRDAQAAHPRARLQEGLLVRRRTLVRRLVLAMGPPLARRLAWCCTWTARRQDLRHSYQCNDGT